MRIKQILLTDILTKRFLNSYKVDPVSGCWNWTGCMEGAENHLYPCLQASVGGKSTRYKAHRYSYTLHVGPIPDGLQLDHECVNPPCVNPGHLKPVTHAENNRLRGARQTHCKYGHELPAENPRTSSGVCRRCHRNNTRARRLGIKLAQYMEREAELDALYAPRL